MNRLRDLREEKEKTLNEVSLDLEIPYQTYRNYEIGKRQPKDKDTWQKLADYYNVSVPYIMGLSDTPQEVNIDTIRKMVLKANSITHNNDFLEAKLENPSLKIVSSTSSGIEGCKDLEIQQFLSATYDGGETAFTALNLTVFIEDIKFDSSVHPVTIHFTIFANKFNQEEAIDYILGLQQVSELTTINIDNFNSDIIKTIITTKNIKNELNEFSEHLAIETLKTLTNAREDIFNDKLSYKVKINFFNRFISRINLG